MPGRGRQGRRQRQREPVTPVAHPGLHQVLAQRVGDHPGDARAVVEDFEDDPPGALVLRPADDRRGPGMIEVAGAGGAAARDDPGRVADVRAVILAHGLDAVGQGGGQRRIEVEAEAIVAVADAREHQVRAVQAGGDGAEQAAIVQDADAHRAVPVLGPARDAVGPGLVQVAAEGRVVGAHGRQDGPIRRGGKPGGALTVPRSRRTGGPRRGRRRRRGPAGRRGCPARSRARLPAAPGGPCGRWC